MNKKIKLAFLSLFILVLNLANTGYSQTITLGSGTAVNGITQSSPVNIWFRKTVCEMVYTFEELNTAMASSGEINELGFFIANNPIFNLPDYTIQMKNTDMDDVSGDLGGGFTTVITIDDYAPAAGGFDMLTLDTPFDWDGTSNIAIRICWSQVTPTFNPSGQLRIYDFDNGYKFFRNDTPGSACGLDAVFLQNVKPQIRFIFQNTTEWTGTVSSDWFIPLNWTSGVPVRTINTVIPGGTPNDPILNAASECKNLTLSGTMTLGAGGQIDVYENFTNTGTYNDLGGITRFTGLAAAHELNTTPDITIANLQGNSSGGTVLTGSGNVIISEELQVNRGLFDTDDRVIIRSDADGTGRINELSTTCTYTINMTDTFGDGWNGGFLTIFEEGEEVGTFFAFDFASSATFEIVADASFTVNYTAGTFENENAYSILDEDGLEIFSDGVNPSTGDVFTDVATGCSFSSTLIGNITMERYIDAGATFWRYFSSAVEGATLAQYLDDFTTSGFPGSPFPDFPFTSIFTYDETLPPFAGYVPASSAAQVIEVGQGLQVYSGDTITGTDPFLVDLVGPANQGDITLPVTFTPSGTPSEDGFSFIGNPYASTINWDAPGWTKTNIIDATYIQNPDTQNYATYISGAGANGGTQFIASQQSFWVQASAGSPELTIRETVKSDVDATYFRAETFSPGMTIQLIGGDLVDEGVIRHIEAATDAVDPQFDAVKLYGGWGFHPQLTVMNNEGKDFTIHSFNKGYEEIEIPLRTIVFENGVHTLKFLNIGELDVPCLKIEDTYSGEFYAIEEGVELEFEMSDTTFAPRFVIHVGRDYISSKENATCNELANGSFEIDFDLDEELGYDLSSDDTLIVGSGFANPLVINDLESGLYTLVIDSLEDFCGENTFNFYIGEPAVISVEEVISDEIAGEDGSINISVEGGTPPYSYDWSTGASTNAISGLTSDFYEVEITDANGCTTSETFFINSLLSLEEEVNDENTPSFVFDQLTNEIHLSNLGNNFGQAVTLYGVDGKHILDYSLTTDSEQSIVLPRNLSKSIYLLKSTDGTWVYKFSN